MYVENMDEKTEFDGEWIGYTRVSTPEQNPQMQTNALLEFGVPASNIFSDVGSGVNMRRPGLAKARSVCRRGDCIVVWKLDRLGRSLVDVLQTVQQLKKDGINIRSITESSIDTTSAMGNMVMQILLAVAEMERNLIAERTRAGIKRYQDEGGKMGKPHYIRDYPKRIDAFRKLYESGALENMTGRDIVNALNAADPKAPQIKVPQVYFNWKSKGYPGFDVPGE